MTRLNLRLERNDDGFPEFVDKIDFESSSILYFKEINPFSIFSNLGRIL